MSKAFFGVKMLLHPRLVLTSGGGGGGGTKIFFLTPVSLVYSKN